MGYNLQLITTKHEGRSWETMEGNISYFVPNLGGGQVALPSF